MPTIDIETAPALSGRERRGVAVRLTRWLTDRLSQQAGGWR